jgi:DNA-3-methyladenine glycosylase I
MSYCKYCQNLPTDNPHRLYHDTEYGFPIHDDDALFGRLILEINQAGLSWDTVLRKRQSFQQAYSQFSIEAVANYQDADRVRLMNDKGIIRNRLKIEAAIFNAQKIREIQQSIGSFEAWLNQHHPRTKDEWVKLFKKNFKFVGGEIVNEFLMSTGFLPGSHEADCPVQERIISMCSMPSSK